MIISTLVALFFSISIFGKVDKQQIHYAVLGLTISVIIWNVAVILNLTSDSIRLHILFEQLYFLGQITVPVFVLFLGLIYAHNRIQFNKTYSLIFIVPLISLGMLFTNQYHHLFYTTFSLIPTVQDFGIYFTLHSIVSYIYIGVGIIHLGIFTLKNSGFYSKQSLLVFLGILIAVVFDSFSTMKIFDWPTYWENVVFTFSIACLILSVIKYDFLSLIPIALKTVVDSLTDSYVVINGNYEIIDYNKRFAETFSRVLNFKRKESIIELIRKSDVDLNENFVIERVGESVKQKKSISFEILRVVNGDDYHYKVEIIPILKKDYHIGTIVLIRDITENKKYLDQITMLNIKLKDMAIRDGLTKTYNRYFFDERLQC